MKCSLSLVAMSFVGSGVLCKRSLDLVWFVDSRYYF